jgi:tetratricopeptide (TPR) repeat protein
MAGFISGRLSQRDARSLALHLLACPECRTNAAPVLSPLLSGKLPNPAVGETSPALDAAYEAALDRAFDAVFEHRYALREKCGVRRALAVYAQMGISGLRQNPGLLRSLTAYRTLLEMCQELRYEDPKRMVDAGFLAVYTADRLSPRRYGAQRVADLRCRARIELGNAYRVADRLDEAERVLGEAVEAFQEGTQDDLLQARLADVRASFLADRRRFDDAGAALDTVYAIYQRRGDRHLAGRALISKGIYVGYGGDPDEAIRLLREGLSLIKAERDPGLVYAALHNQAAFLLTSGRLREARALLWKAPSSSEALGGRVNLLKIRWLAAQIDAELGDLGRAEQTLCEVKQGFEEAGLYYKAALVSLERVTVLIQQERHEEARDLVVEVLGVFKVLRISREALGSLLLLDRAFEEQAVTGAVVEAVLEMLKQAEHEPGASGNAFENGTAAPLVTAIAV